MKDRTLEAAAPKEEAPPYPISYPAYGYRNSGASRWARYVHFFKRLWPVPLLTAALGLTVAAWQLVRKPAIYQSSARMWVSGKLRMPENSYYSEELQFFFGTQVELLQSRKIQQAARLRVQTLNPALAPCN